MRCRAGIAQAGRLQRRGPASRRGSIMTWFAVFLFALLPLMTLIIHIGTVTLTRRQMQTAVNTAALEGLRFRDSGLSETARRTQVQALTAAVFDDNLDPSDGDSLRLGAGPIIPFASEPTEISLPGTDFKASRTIRAANFSQYDPVLQLNLGNERHGDMTSGQYVATADHTEGNTYLRADLLHPGDPGYDATQEDDAFLVRLRRTDNSGSLDDLTGISSRGPTLPFLFGRGPYGDSTFLDRRERGTQVRAAAIAVATPAQTVGPFSTDVGAGAAPLWIDVGSWNSLTTGVPVAVVVSGADLTGGITGQFVQLQWMSVGDELTSDTATAITGQRYVAVTSLLPSGTTRRIVGFGVAQLDLTLAGGTIERLESQIGQSNATAHWRANLNGLSPADLAALLALRNTQDEPLLAPALARSLD